MTTPYARGAAFERSILNWWRGFGEDHYGIRSAGSKGAIDLILWDSSEVWLIQAKADKMTGPELVAAKEALRQVPFPTLFRGGSFPMLADNPAAFHQPHREVWMKSPVRGDDWIRYEVDH